MVTRAPPHPSKIHVALRLHFLRASIRRRYLKLRPVAQADITALLAMNRPLQSFQLSLPLCCSSFCSQLSEASEFMGKRRGWGGWGGGVGQPEHGKRKPEKTQAGVGVVAAECDGYNNPCRGSTHVLNCCHRCSSIGQQRDHQTHSAISGTDALSFSVPVIAP